MNKKFFKCGYVLLLVISSVAQALDNQAEVAATSAPQELVEPRFDHMRPPKAIEYPSAAKRRGEEGVTWVKALVSEIGSILDVEVVASSGSPDIDRSVVKGVRTWKLIPGSFNGKPIAMWIYVPTVMRLGDKQKTEQFTPQELAAAKEARQLQDNYLRELRKTLSSH